MTKYITAISKKNTRTFPTPNIAKLFLTTKAKIFSNTNKSDKKYFCFIFKLEIFLCHFLCRMKNISIIT